MLFGNIEKNFLAYAHKETCPFSLLPHVSLEEINGFVNLEGSTV